VADPQEDGLAISGGLPDFGDACMKAVISRDSGHGHKVASHNFGSEDVASAMDQRMSELFHFADLAE